MTAYSLAWPLQKAVFGALEAALAPAVPVHDLLPADTPLAETYVTLGEEEARQIDPTLTDHRLDITIHSRAAGYGAAKAAAQSVLSALAVPPALETGRLVSLTFLRARAARVTGRDTRRIILTFRALTES